MDEVLKALQPLASLVSERARKDPAVRAALEGLGKALLAIAASDEPAESAARQPETPLSPEVPAPDEVPPRSPVVPPPLPAPSRAWAKPPVRDDAMPQDIRRLLEQFTPAQAERARATTEREREDGWEFVAEPARLDAIAARCRVKARATRWVREQGPRSEGDPILPDDLEGEQEALGANRLWMTDWRLSRVSPEALRDLENTLDVAADAATLLATVLDNPEGTPDVLPALRLAAEAQSALRVAALAVRGDDGTRWNDQDQFELFQFIRAYSEQEQHFIDRYMRLDDAADPAESERLRARLADLNLARERRRERPKRVQKAQGRIRYHLKKLDERGTSSGEQDWRGIAAAVQELADDGVSPDEAGLRDLLREAVARLPEIEGMPPAFLKLARELSPKREPLGSETPPPPRLPSPEVQELKALLGGGTLLFIGGEPRQDSAAKLQKALQPTRITWISTKEHQSYRDFEPAVAREDVLVVLLPVRFASHDFIKVKDLCEEHGKLFVQLPGGYGANQIAHQVLNQIGDRLRARATNVESEEAAAN